MIVKYQDVFVPGGFPKLTYNPRLELQLEQKLSESKENLCKLITITGQTKSGKTVLAKRVFDPKDSVWVDGGMVATEEDFWETVLERLGLFDAREEEASKETGNKLTGKASSEANFLLAKGTVEFGAERELKHVSSIRRGRSVSPHVVASEGLRRTRIPLVIDDYHYIDRNIQGKLVRALKPLIFEGVPIAIIAIPHRRYDAVKVEKEMTGRISHVSIPVWNLDELSYIANIGFSHLNIKMDSDFVYRMASEAIGSPHLMQEFCRGICRQANLGYVEKLYVPLLLDELLDHVFRDIAETIGRPIFEKLARGPRARTDRLQRELKNGRNVDIYELVLHGLAYIRPALVSIEYEDLRTAIKEVSSSQAPQIHEVARVLKHMATIAATDQSSTPVIEFEEEEKRLHITDPFFAFYLRWGELTTKN